MDDVKNQFKGLVKKINNPFSSSSSGFKGEGRKLGSTPENQTTAQHQEWKKLQQERWEKDRRPGSAPASSQSLGQPSSAASAGYSKQSVSVQSLNNEGYESQISTTIQTQSLEKPVAHSKYGRDEISHNHDIGNSHDSINSAAKESRCCTVGVSDAKTDAVGVCNANYSKPDAVEVSNVKSGELELNYNGNETSSHHHHHEVEIRKPDANGVKPCSTSAGDGDSNTKSGSNPDADRISNVKSGDFNPFSPYIGSKSSTYTTDGLRMFQCPVCNTWFRTEKEVNTHVDECLNKTTSTSSGNANDSKSSSEVYKDRIKSALGVFLSGGPSSDTLDVILRILRNIVSNPEMEKFRKLRLSNAKIHNTIGMALGGVELLEALGFEYQTQEDEMWGVMAIPSKEQIQIIEEVISELEPSSLGPSKEEPEVKSTTVIQRKVDRQIRVFCAGPDNLAAKMDLPHSFFQLSASELKHEAAARKKKLEDSQLFVSRASREKLAATNKRKYKATIIRVQFPDGVILQGMFLPWEPTSALYEFVASSLRNPILRFDLFAPIALRQKIIPATADGKRNIPTLEEANLVPACLVKFQCVEEDALLFTGLHPDLLSKLEPLTSSTLPSQ